MFRKVFVLCFLLAIHTSFANSSFRSGKVTSIVLHDWGRALVILEDGVVTSEPCVNKSSIALQKDNPFFTEMYAALLAAYHSDSSVGGWVDGCDSRVNTPILTRLDLIPKKNKKD